MALYGGNSLRSLGVYVVSCGYIRGDIINLVFSWGNYYAYDIVGMLLSIKPLSNLTHSLEQWT